jgi:hypothetical protein
VADDNDVIIDDLQSELADLLDEEDEKKGIKVTFNMLIIRLLL